MSGCHLCLLQYQKHTDTFLLWYKDPLSSDFALTRTTHKRPTSHSSIFIPRSPPEILLMARAEREFNDAETRAASRTLSGPLHSHKHAQNDAVPGRQLVCLTMKGHTHAACVAKDVLRVLRARKCAHTSTRPTIITHTHPLTCSCWRANRDILCKRYALSLFSIVHPLYSHVRIAHLRACATGKPAILCTRCASVCARDGILWTVYRV